MPASHLLPPLVISRSLALTVVLAAMHAGALACVWLLPLPVFVRASLAAVVAFSGYRALCSHGLRTAADAVVALKENGERRYARRGADEDWRPCEIEALFVHPALALVRVTFAEGASHVVIAGDAVRRDAFRDWRRDWMWGRSSRAALRDGVE